MYDKKHLLFAVLSLMRKIWIACVAKVFKRHKSPGNGWEKLKCYAKWNTLMDFRTTLQLSCHC